MPEINIVENTVFDEYHFGRAKTAEMYFNVTFIGCTFIECNLTSTSFSSCRFSDCVFSNCNMTKAVFDSVFDRCKFDECDLNEARFSLLLNRVGFFKCNLNNLSLCRVVLARCDFYMSDLDKAIISGDTDFIKLMVNESAVPPLLAARLEILPREGEFIGWKKLAKNLVAELLIPATALRSNAGGRKCRCSIAKVISITEAYDPEITHKEGRSRFNPSFKYKVGKEVVPNIPFDEDRWAECAPGIHFFLTREEAVDYSV